MASQQPPSQEELASLFSRNLTLEPVRAVGQVEIPNEEPKIVYASQHYIQPTFVAQPAPSNPVVPAVLSSGLPKPLQFADEQAAEVVRHLNTQGVDTTGVSPAQLNLFRLSDIPQRTLLINLWRTCPPVPNSEESQTWWAATTVEQERHLASIRYEQEQMELQAQLEAESAAAHQQSMTDTMMGPDTTPLTPVQSNDGSWIQTIPATYMEPYMMSGYEEMARREYEESARRALAEDMVATKGVITGPQDSVSRPYNPAHSDPVYQNAGNGGGFRTVADWRRGQEMENQYGRLMNQLNRW